MTLLVVLGTMLFQVFHQASQVVEIANARQEIFQYARAALEFLDRELNGAFTGVDANVNTGIKGMRIFDRPAWAAHPTPRNSQGIFFSSGILVRDTRGTPRAIEFGKDVNFARIAYYLNDETTELPKAAIYRYEGYDLSLDGTGGRRSRDAVRPQLPALQHRDREPPPGPRPRRFPDDRLGQRRGQRRWAATRAGAGCRRRCC